MKQQLADWWWRIIAFQNVRIFAWASRQETADYRSLKRCQAETGWCFQQNMTTEWASNDWMKHERTNEINQKIIKIHRYRDKYKHILFSNFCKNYFPTFFRCPFDLLASSQLAVVAFNQIKWNQIKENKRNREIEEKVAENCGNIIAATKKKEKNFIGTVCACFENKFRLSRSYNFYCGQDNWSVQRFLFHLLTCRLCDKFKWQITAKKFINFFR